LHDDDFVRSLHATTLPSLSDHSFKGDKLTPDDRTRITSNIRGYDISPDMVRLSLVNLYLHGFPEPHIYEYDSLTSEDRWNEFYDVILANPPFMSPKGGIRPHKRFSVQSNRSEVLFVDLMAEHLTPGGRAAIVVPEGIIFQSGTAYKSLRKMLVDDYLVGVISLPAGVFNPYSGVKTSILWLDKSLARKTNQILFAKITADGFDLGAQRRPVKQNDLPGAFRAIQQYIEFLQIGSMPIHDDIDDDSVRSLHDDDIDDDSVRTLHATSRQGTESTLQSIYPHITLVDKSAIAENGDYNLSGERYKINAKINTAFPLVYLGNEELFKIESGGTPNSQDAELWNGDIKWITLVDLPQSNFITEIYDSERKITTKGLNSSSAKLLPTDSVVISSRATIGRIAICKVELATNQGFKNLIIKDKTKVNPKYLAFSLTKIVPKMEALASGGTFKEISKSNFATLQIPLPTLSIQQEIVTEIEAYQKIIDGARQVVENYKPRISIDPDWEIVELGEICDINKESANPTDLYVDWFNYIDIASVENGTGVIAYTNKIPVNSAPSRARRILRTGDILLSTVRPNLQAIGFFEFEPLRHIASTGFAVLRTDTKCISKYLYYTLFQEMLMTQMIGKMEKGSYPSINQSDVSELRIPLPPLEIQQQIVAQIEREQSLVNASKELIALFEQKIKDRIARVWGE
jgi:type I restriction enzyme M protein